MASGNGYVRAKVTQIGFADTAGLEGVMVLTSEDGRNFPMSSFSGEVSQHIKRFLDGDRVSVPTIYKMIEEIAEDEKYHLSRVEVYSRGNVLRADLFFAGRNGELKLRNYRASDSIALAVYYDVDILVESGIFDRAAR